MIWWNYRDFSVPGLKRHTGQSFYFSYDKPCGKLALGQNCIKIYQWQIKFRRYLLYGCMYACMYANCLLAIDTSIDPRSTLDWHLGRPSVNPRLTHGWHLGRETFNFRWHSIEWQSILAMNTRTQVIAGRHYWGGLRNFEAFQIGLCYSSPCNIWSEADEQGYNKLWL